MKRKRWVMLLTLVVVLFSSIVVILFAVHSATNITPREQNNREGQQAGTVNLHIAEQPTATPSPTPALIPTATATPVASATSSAGSAADWTLIYSDNFSGTQLNPTWGTYSGPHGGGKSYYDPSEVQVQNGLLHIFMERKTTNGLLYTTGGLAAFKLAQVYGRYEFRARLPHGKGVGPYTILWPGTTQPNTAQVDLFESPPVNKDKIYCTNHGADGSSGQVIVAGNFADDFHTFAYEWVPGQIRVYIDGVQQGTITNDVPNFPMWFGMAVSSGDAFTGDPDPTTVLPVSLDVAWVHIYKYNAG